MTARCTRLAVGVVLLVLAVAGCTQVLGPTRTARDYELKAASTADAVVSALRTAGLVVQAADEGNALAPYVSVTLADAESAATGAVSTFESLQPPGSSSDALRDELTPLLADATDGLAALRITARRGQLGALAAEAAPLGAVADDLEAFAEEHG